MASFTSAGVARAAVAPRPNAAPTPLTMRKSRRFISEHAGNAFREMSSVAQGRQERDHVLDLLRGQQRLPAKRGCNTPEPFGLTVGGHDRRRIQVHRIDDAQPKL